LVKLVLEDGKIKEVLKRRGICGSAAVVDWINFTIGDETFDQSDDAISERYDFVAGEVVPVEEGGTFTPVTSDQVAIVVSNRLQEIFGFGIAVKLGYGLNFYAESWAMPHSWGTVSYGGQNKTVLVSLTGTGLAAAKEGWELRLRSFLEKSQRPRITRLDLAHDDYNGSTYNVNRADQDHTDGLYNCGGRNPSCEYRGDWKNPNGKGRSFYVGNRKNGKYCRVYEKGRELGAPASEWVRIEVEFKSVDRVIPFDALTSPGEYLAGAYPAFAWINQHQERIFTTQRVVQAGVDKAVKWLRHQAGTHIHYLAELFGVDGLIERVSRSDKVPKFALVPNWTLAEPSIHLQKVFQPRVNLGAAATAW
jgi:phage replication initiation protein